MTIYVTVIRNPKDDSKDYEISIDVAQVLYLSGQLEKDKKGNYCTPGIDDPEIGLHIPVSTTLADNIQQTT